MATAKKKTSKKPSNGLTWNPNPNGGQYAHYKLGTIFLYKGSYSYHTAYNKYYNADSLAQAKKKIDQYTNFRMKELRDSKAKIQPKKR